MAKQRTKKIVPRDVRGFERTARADNPTPPHSHRLSPKAATSGGTAKKAMDYAAAFDWPGYFNAVANKPARETLVKALDLIDAEDVRAAKSRKRAPRPKFHTAIDIGCGEGRDTRALLRHTSRIPWSLMATDGSAHGLDILLESLTPAEHRRLYVAQSLLEELPRRYPTAILHSVKELRAAQVDLVNASFVLPFCPPRHLPALWRWIVARIRPGGRFAGQFFGDRDTWAHVRKTTGIPRTRLDRMFKDFVFEELREEEKDDVTTMGEPKHWHVYHIVARKRT
jgi:SAM-dependent methyltransferase